MAQVAFSVGQPGQPIADTSVEQLVQNAASSNVARAILLQACCIRTSDFPDRYLKTGGRQIRGFDASQNSFR